MSDTRGIQSSADDDGHRLKISKGRGEEEEQAQLSHKTERNAEGRDAMRWRQDDKMRMLIQR